MITTAIIYNIGRGLAFNVVLPLWYVLIRLSAFSLVEKKHFFEKEECNVADIRTRILAINFRRYALE